MMAAERIVAKKAGENPDFHAVNIMATKNIMKGGEVLIYGWMNDLTPNARTTVNTARIYGRIARRLARTKDLLN